MVFVQLFSGQCHLTTGESTNIRSDWFEPWTSSQPLKGIHLLIPQIQRLSMAALSRIPIECFRKLPPDLTGKVVYHTTRGINGGHAYVSQGTLTDLAGSKTVVCYLLLCTHSRLCLDHLLALGCGESCRSFAEYRGKYYQL